MPLRAVLVDVDFTIARPGPLLGPEGYRGAVSATAWRSTRRVHDAPGPPPSSICGITRSSSTTRRSGSGSPRTSSEAWGATAPASRGIAVEIVRAWEHSTNFELYDDVSPVLAELRGMT